MQQCKPSLGLKKPRQGVFGWVEPQQQVHETWPGLQECAGWDHPWGWVSTAAIPAHQAQCPACPLATLCQCLAPLHAEPWAVCPLAFQQPPSPAAPRVQNVRTSQSQVGWAGIPHAAAKGCQAGTSEHSPAPHTAQDSSAT